MKMLSSVNKRSLKSILDRESLKYTFGVPWFDCFVHVEFNYSTTNIIE